MAETDASGGDNNHKKIAGVKKAKRLSTRVDMTPMVDLGFLLITFFIFTTSMSTPSTMSLNMPKTKDVDSMTIKASDALTLMIGRETKEKRQVYYYLGKLEADGSNFKTASFKDIRQIIINKRKEVMNRFVEDPTDSICTSSKQYAKLSGDPEWQNACRNKKFVVVIKPTKEASYASIIDLLDEMAINGVKSFAVIDILPQEKELLEKSEAIYDLR
jgi:biopolymer transport protein ExbD